MNVTGIALLASMFFGLSAASASASDDTSCAGARYRFGEPFLDTTKLDSRPGSLPELDVDPIVKIDRIQRLDGDVRRTIGYVYYNGDGHADLASAPEPLMTLADKNAFRQMMLRLGPLRIDPSQLMPGTQFGNGVLRFIVGTKLKEVLGPDNSLAECIRPSLK